MHTLDGIGSVRILQKERGYRFSVDAPLLASFVRMPRISLLADIGAGSGIIGILLAKRYPDSQICLIELQDDLADLADRNLSLNNIGDRARVVRGDVLELLQRGDLNDIAGNCDLVVSNPPFRRRGTGLTAENEERAIARHELNLTLRALAETAAALVRHHGRLCLIHLPERMPDIFETLRSHRLEPKRLRFIHSDIRTEARMVLIESVRGGKPGLTVEHPLFVYERQRQYSDEVRAMVEGKNPDTTHPVLPIKDKFSKSRLPGARSGKL